MDIAYVSMCKGERESRQSTYKTKVKMPQFQEVLAHQWHLEKLFQLYAAMEEQSLASIASRALQGDHLEYEDT